MGERGPQQTDTATLLKRGSWRGKQRLKEERKRRSRKQTGFIKGEPCLLDDDELQEVCRTFIPGYDPWDDCGTCYFDVDAARHAIDFFFVELTHVKGKNARKPFVLELWEIAIIGNLFGWKREDGTRRYRECLIYVPRKNAR